MKISRTLLLAVAAFGSASAFTASLPSPRQRTTSSSVVVVCAAEAAMAEAGVPSTTSSDPSDEFSDVAIPTNLPSDCGKDYIPLATMLATGQLAQADQVRRTTPGLLLSRQIDQSTDRQAASHLKNLVVSHTTNLSPFATVYKRHARGNLGGQSKGSRLCLFHRCQEHPRHRLGHDRATVEQILGWQVWLLGTKAKVEAGQG